MQNNNQNGKKSKDFDILLACCVLVIGVSGYVFLSGAAREKKQVEQTGLVAEAQPVQEEPADPTMAQTNEQEKETSTATRKTVMPVSGQVLQDYAMEQLAYNETTRDWRTHDGVDLAADSGTDIYAFADGQVFATGESSSLGQYIILCHEGDYTTLYAHCRCITKTGGRVKMGEKIAEVGQTGMATGPHLHFQLQQGERYLNPLYYVEVQTT